MITPEQRETRRHYLGASDMAILLAEELHYPLPYKKTSQDVYYSKVMQLPDESSESMDVGNWLEMPMLQWAARELGIEIITDPEKLISVAQHGPGKGLLAANHDALVVGKREGVEAKFRNAENAQQFGQPGTDEVPMDVVVQVQDQMYCGDLDVVHVVLATPTYYSVDISLYHVPRDEQIIPEIADFGSQWWRRHIEAKTPPDGQATPPLYVLKALERKAGVQIRLPDEAVLWADQRVSLKERIKTLEADVEDMDAKLIHALGEAEIGLLLDGRTMTYQQTESHRFDTKRFKLEHPELAPEYTNVSCYRTLRIKKK